MNERPVSADEARQVPWHKRNKAQRKAISAEANAKNNARFKSRMAEIREQEKQGLARIKEDEQARPASAPVRGQRRSSSFGDPNAIIWDYLPHPYLLVPIVLVALVVFVVVLLVLL